MSTGREPTKVGTPCEVCGKPLTKALLKHAPWAETCNRPCFMIKVIREMSTLHLLADLDTLGPNAYAASELKRRGFPLADQA